MQKLIKSIALKYSILDAYLIKNILPSFIFSLVICSIVAELIGISFEQIRYITEWELSVAISIYIHYLKLPSFIAIALPYAILFSTLFTYTRLSRNSEIIALQSFGVSLYRLAFPAFVIGILASTMMFSLNELIVPSANYKAAMVFEKEMNVDRNILDKYHKRNIIYKEYSAELETSKKQQNLKFILFAESFKEGKLLDIIILNYSNHKLTEIINSNSAEWDKNHQKWKLNDGERNLLTSNGNFGERIYFKILFINNISKNLWDYINLNRDHREMHIWELYKKLTIIKNMEDIKAMLKLKIAIFRRYTNPCSCFIFALLGCSAGINRQSKANSISRRFILVVTVILIYYTLNFLVNYFCLSQVIPISWGMWIPNVVAITIAIFILMYNNQSFVITKKSKRKTGNTKQRTILKFFQR
ncbi:LptF/LptG family permease [Plectonema cf. radiosum LEGE 06105]|uniref:LptF/LptG family permease n=1 Tax=Plectonema cf. radiosum LEGE 06105 TaxID=945769 RepID=A0A8J7FL46_9CYAN|nr:LptF/LptG family permease [Plectonema radiosum]MBE9215561.1 LptF/LptG family permease [Plectonema cf. radiosum LEGE 06105]